MPPVAIAEFANFQIEKMMIHEIFKLDDARNIVPPRLNNTLTVLDEEGLRVLGERVVAAIGVDSKSVEMDISDRSEGSVYFHVNRILNEETNEVFIDRSREITWKLARSQTSRNLPGGVVVILKGTTGYDLAKFVLIIKAEWQDGFRKSGNNAMSYVNDILLTPQQRLYKIGAFVRRGDATKAFVYDHNMSKAEENGMASYFYLNFLGCDMLHTNKFFTTKFYNGAKEFINSSPSFDDEQKYDLNTHLYSYMKSETQTTISIADFANQYLPDPVQRDEFSRYMRLETFRDEAFNRSITKDISDIKSKLRMRKMYFSGNIKISGPSEGFDEKVTIQEKEHDENGTIISTIVKIRGIIEGLDR